MPGNEAGGTYWPVGGSRDGSEGEGHTLGEGSGWGEFELGETLPSVSRTDALFPSKLLFRYLGN